jgi:translation initiation factor 2 beta subunit (eIF-2beta)/eIF-5
MKTKCPFCGSTNNNWSDKDKLISITCRRCGASGPKVESKDYPNDLKIIIEYAKIKWDTRKE